MTKSLESILKEEYGGFDSINRLDILDAVTKWLKGVEEEYSKEMLAGNSKTFLNGMDKVWASLSEKGTEQK